jgi:hypothetical protein
MNISRRKFGKIAAFTTGLGVVNLLNPNTLNAIVNTQNNPNNLAIDKINLQNFQSLKNKKFQIDLDSNKNLIIKLEKVVSMSFDNKTEQFILFFKGKNDVNLEEKIYHLQNANLGDFDLFLMPSEKKQGYQYYQAIFNQFK